MRPIPHLGFPIEQERFRRVMALARSLVKALIATSRESLVSRARYTSAMPPRRAA
jgi:hypothetical protein